MLTDDKLQDWLRSLTSENPTIVVSALQRLFSDPVSDNRLLTYVEELLEDKRLAVLGAPFHYGFVAHEAAFAVAAMRNRLGIKEIVTAKGVFNPLNEHQLELLRRKANIDWQRSGYEGSLKVIQMLLDLGHIALYDLELDPKDFLLEKESKSEKG